MQINKKNLINLSLLIFSSSFCIFFTEFTLRKVINFNKGSQVNYLKKDEIIYGLKLGKANQKVSHNNNRGDYNVKVEFNELGLRDRRDLREAKENSFIIVGDSFTFGFGVEEDDRFSNLLLTNYKIDNYNVAIPNDLYGYEALIKYSEYLGAKSNNLILGICMENDLFKNEKISENKKISLRKFNSNILKSSKKILLNNSAIYFASSSAIHKNKFIKNIFIKLGFIEQILESQISSNYELNKSADFIKKISKKYNSYIVIIPSRYNWYGEYSFIEKTRKEHSLFVKLLREKNLKVIDLRNNFEKKSANPLDEFHFKFDGHWNKKGHIQASKEIGDFIINDLTKQ